MPADVDFGSEVKGGMVENRRFQFGNMVLSRWPLLSVRRHLLPRSMRLSKLNLQRGALESYDRHAGWRYPVLFGPPRSYRPDERHAQIEALKSIAPSAYQRPGWP
jgi:endonuclease/exonuclease/phosphatase family metal-dependent hydrolase